MLKYSTIFLSVLLVFIGKAHSFNMDCSCHVPDGARSAVLPKSRRRTSLASISTTGPKDVIIYFAADGHGDLFVNGEYISTCGWQNACNKALTLEHGDVISVNGTDSNGSGPYGILVGIFDTELNPLLVTGQNGWVAQNQNDLDTNNEDWKKPGYDACHWPSAGAGTTAADTNGFPSGIGATYAWAQGSNGHDVVLLRHRVGGETCCVFNNNSETCNDGTCSNCLLWSGTGYSQQDCYKGWSRSQCYAANEDSSRPTSDYTWCGSSV